jgi:hypothetical protein
LAFGWQFFFFIAIETCGGFLDGWIKLLVFSVKKGVP